MSSQVVTRTLKANLCNHSQVRDDLDSHGFGASKLWNVGRWTISRVWDAVGYIPDADELCSYLKTHDRYADLHSQSSQRVLQELGHDIELVAPVDDLQSPTAESIPKPQHFLLEDINVCDDEVGHQHVDFVYYGRVGNRTIDPEPGVAAAEEWEWFTAAALQQRTDDLEPDVVKAGQRAIDTV